VNVEVVVEVEGIELKGRSVWLSVKRQKVSEWPCVVSSNCEGAGR
jgi:hypothetical protein